MKIWDKFNASFQLCPPDFNFAPPPRSREASDAPGLRANSSPTNGHRTNGSQTNDSRKNGSQDKMGPGQIDRGQMGRGK